jgi:hypothetical protein
MLGLPGSKPSEQLCGALRCSGNFVNDWLGTMGAAFTILLQNFHSLVGIMKPRCANTKGLDYITFRNLLECTIL